MPCRRWLLASVVVAGLAFPSAAPAATTGPPRSHTVYPGQTLGKIARRYNVSIDELCHANGLRRNARLRPGQKIRIPGGDEEEGAPPTPHRANRWQDFEAQPRHRGLVTLVSPTRRWRGYVLSPRGKVLPKAREAIERMFASWRTGSVHEVDTRLIRLVVTLSDTFGGRPLRVVSGYRERSFAVESKHKVGRAFDFSIPGIPNSLVRDHLRTLRDVGVGYYPNSTHLHVDVREASAYWQDDAAPGERPRYPHRGGVEDDDRDAPEPDEEDTPPPRGSESDGAGPPDAAEEPGDQPAR